MKKIYLFISLVFSLVSFSQGPGGSCSTIASFCGDASVPFNNVTNTLNLGNIGCLGTSPNGAWYSFQVSTSGLLEFEISQTNAAGVGIDVDYICWGPFTTDPRVASNLCTTLLEDYPNGSNASANNIVDCSYSGDPVENFSITNAVAGQFYVLLITNYSNQSGTITFDQTNNTGGANGSTNCEICGVSLGPDRFICNSAVNSVTLTANFYSPPVTPIPLNYRWYLNGVLQTTTTTNSLVVNQNGVWRVEVDRVACAGTEEYDEIIVDIASGIATNIIGPFSGPTGECNPTFDLTSYLTDLMNPSNPSNYTYEFYDLSDGSLIPDPTNFTPLSTTQVIIKITLGICESYSDPIDIIVDCVPVTCSLTLTSSAATIGQSVCINQAISDIIYTAGGSATGVILLSGALPAGVTGSFASGIYTISGTPTETGTFNYTVETVGCSPELNLSGTIMIGTTPVLAITNPSAVCFPSTVDITAASVTSGSTGAGLLSYWSDSAGTITLPNPTAISISGTYYIQSSVGTCTDIEAVVVTINTTPVLTITNPSAVCSPSTVDITASAVTSGSTGGGVLSYWSDAAATISLPNPTAISTSGTYYIQSTLGSCSDIEPVVVTINTTPVLTITNPSAVCSPSTVDITASTVTSGSTGGGVLSYWSDAAGTISLPSPTAISISGTYYIQSSVGTCTDIEAVVVTINTTPVLTITNPSAVCFPSTVDITVASVTAGSTGGGVLSYWEDSSATISLPNPTAISTSGTYYIQSTLGSCSDIEPVVVTINTTPVLTITNPSAVCSPSTVDITASTVTSGSTGGGVLSYWSDAAGTISLPSPTAISISGTYYIQSSVGTCTDIEAVVVTINTTPVLTITNPSAVCSPSTVDITASAVTSGSTGGGVLSYWSDAAATISLPNPTAISTSGTYYIQSTLGSCSDIEPVVVTINTTPVLTITNPSAVCSPSTVDITASTVTSGSTGGGVLSYWSDAAGTISLPSPTAISISGTYYIQSSVGTCTDIEAVVVTINTTPVLTITNPSAVCFPSTVDITVASVTAGSTGGGVLSYWEDSSATISLPNPTAISTSGTYYIQSTLGSCSDIEPVVVTINTTPVLTITNPSAVCSPSTVDITASTVTSGSTGGGVLSYWSDAAGTISLPSPTAISISGTYYIQSSVGTCTDIEAVVVTINTTPVLTITNPSAVCSPSTVDITASAVTSGSTGGGVLSYWSDAAATISLPNPTAISTSGTYYIQSTLGSCSDIEPVVVTINTTPVLTITNPSAVCSPSTVDITASTVTSGSTGGGVLSYWSDAAGTISLPSPTAISISGTYYIQSSVGTCTDIEAVVVTINTTPVLTITNPSAVCFPSTVDITVASVTAGSTGGGVLSYWEDSSATISLSNPTAITTSGTYYIQSTLGSCSDIEPVVVTINTTPVLTITNPSAVCFPSTVDITASAVTSGSTGGGVLSYWSDAAGTISLSNPTAITTNGTYYIQSTLGSCSDIEPVVITINTTPVLTITNPSAVCFPSTVDITASAVTSGSTGGGVLSYWSDAAGTISLPNPTAISTSGTYYIQSSVGNCTDIKPVVVTILPLPTIVSVTNNGPICLGSTAIFTINASPNTQVIYSINSNPNQTVTINSSGVRVVSFAGVTGNTTLNTVSVFDGVCTSNVVVSSTVNLFANTTIALVSPVNTENQSRCAGVTIDPIQYQVTGTATGVVVTGLPVGVTYNYNTASGLVTISGSANTGGVYNYSVTTTGGCNPQVSATGSITITGLPVLSYSVTNTICNGSTLDFVLNSSLPNTSYIWSATVSNISGSYSTTTNGDETNINQIATLTNPENIGTITMIIIPTANGCFGAASSPIVITVNPIPVVESVSVADNSVCSATNATNNVHVDIVGNISGITYTWTAITSGVNVVGGPISGTITATSTTASLDLRVITSNPLVAGTIYFVVTPVRNGCAGNPMTSGIVTVNPNPGLPIPSPVKTICSGNSTDLIVDVSPLITGTQLTWEVLTVVNVTGANPGTGVAPVTINDVLTATTNTQGYVIYRVRSTLGDCQGGYTDYRVNVNPSPRPVLTDGNICITATGEVYQTYTLNTGLNDVDYDFEWFDSNGDIIPGATNSTLVVDAAGTYSVIATNWLTGCSSDPLLASATATVTETTPATVMTVVQSEYFSDNATITVNVTGGSGTLLYSIDEGSFQSSNVFTGVSAGEHLVTVIDTEGCTYMTQEVLVIDYPTYFTPNGDGINDTWNIIGLNQADAKLYIFDRYGKLLKQLSATQGSEGWDGTYNQAELPSTDYWFTLDYTENGVAKQFKAHFSLNR